MKKYLPKVKSEQAKVCKGNVCLTVYGETARMINAIAFATALLILGALVIKALK
jgi:hypothetical protein